MNATSYLGRKDHAYGFPVMLRLFVSKKVIFTNNL